MTKKFWAAIFIMVHVGLAGGAAGAAPVADRADLVRAVYSAFPFLVKLAAKNPALSRLTPEQRQIFVAISQTSDLGELIFDDQAADFVLNPGEPARLMRTAVRQPGPVFVNRPMLNAPGADFSLGFLLKLFFHEAGNKITAHAMADRDRAAQNFEDLLEPFIHRYELDDGGALHVISVPRRDIKDEVVRTSLTRPQPGNLLLLERDGRYTDLTEAVLKELEKPASAARSLWVEVNRWIVGFLRSAGESVERQIRDQLFAVDPEAGAAWDGVKGFLDIHELRVLEIQDVESVSSVGELHLNIKALLTISNTTKSKVNFNIKGFDALDIFPVPMNIVVNVSKRDSPRVIIGLRPAIENAAGAEVKSVLREALGDVQQLKIVLESPTPPPADTYLVADQAMGYRMFPARDIEPLGAGKWSLVFPIPLETVDRGRMLVAESLFLGSHRAVYLNRLIQLTKAAGESAPVGSDAEMVPESVGFWATQNGGPRLLKKFDDGQPVLLMENVDAEYPVFNPAKLPLQFEYRGSAPVQEVRFHFQRMASIMDLSQEANPRVDMAQWGEHEFPITTEGSIEVKRDYYEIISASGAQISASGIVDGKRRVTVNFKAPWLPIRDLKRTEAFMIPLIHPILIEAVLSDGTVLSQSFSLGDDCVSLLTQAVRPVDRLK